ncbi:MAG TPA: histidine kinase dimerization/phospho-acceptor domain-containing protein [Bryobacteraceae bacterium]|nr:histidine kinase dimerization/phospho-acceptor domain-containing protein [Bryobacteraceae bacterium]
MLTTMPDLADSLSTSVQPMTAVLSTLVHDLRQPLSVIEACADYLDLVLPPEDPRTRQQLELLQQQVGDANRIMHEALIRLHYADGAR